MASFNADSYQEVKDTTGNTKYDNHEVASNAAHPRIMGRGAIGAYCVLLSIN